MGVCGLEAVVPVGVVEFGESIKVGFRVRGAWRDAEDFVWCGVRMRRPLEALGTALVMMVMMMMTMELAGRDSDAYYIGLGRVEEERRQDGLREAMAK